MSKQLTPKLPQIPIASKTMSLATHSLFNQILSWFRSYVELYHSDDAGCQEPILLKEKHSIRVAALCGVIAKELRLPCEDIALAKIIGLLHDIARFEQYTRYQTFNDKDSFDHGEFGAKLLSKVPPLKAIDSNLYAIISSAVLHHNKLNIPITLSRREGLHARIVRDADKLDIIYLTCRIIQSGSTFPAVFPVQNGHVSSQLIGAIGRKKQMNHNMVQSLNDFYLLNIGWVYDLNFKASLAIIYKRHSIDILKAVLPTSIELEEQFIQIDRYIQEQLSQPQPSVCPG